MSPVSRAVQLEPRLLLRHGIPTHPRGRELPVHPFAGHATWRPEPDYGCERQRQVQSLPRSALAGGSSARRHRELVGPRGWTFLDAVGGTRDLIARNEEGDGTRAGRTAEG